MHARLDLQYAWYMVDLFKYYDPFKIYGMHARVDLQRNV